MIKSCIICGKGFTAREDRIKCCSKECSKINESNYKHTPKYIEYLKRVALVAHNKSLRKKICVVCNKEFLNSHPSAKCCSKDCFKNHYKERKNKYYQTDKYKEMKKKYNQIGEVKEKNRQRVNKWVKSKKGKEYIKIYNSLEKNKKHIKEYNIIYRRTQEYKNTTKALRQTIRYKESQKRYNLSLKGKLAILRKGNKRRAMKNNIIETYTEKEWKDKIKSTNGVCPGFEVKPHYVGIDKLTRDHDYPISEASKDFIRTGIKRIYTINNMQPLCMVCNSRKRTKIIEPILVPIILLAPAGARLEESKPKDLNTLEY